MSYSIDSGKYIGKLPHKKEFVSGMKNLSADSYQKIIEVLNDEIDENEINTSSWIPAMIGRGLHMTPYTMLVGTTKKLWSILWIDFV